MPLNLSPTHQQIMQAHAEQAYPNECCGLLVGTVSRSQKVVVEVCPLTNAWNDRANELNDGHTQTDRYWIAPETMLATMRYARSRSLEIIGVFHSHPDRAAVPSEYDRRFAWETYSYIIISVRQGKAREFYSWNLDANHQFQPEAIVMAESIVS